jgi:hypothetical protein
MAGLIHLTLPERSESIGGKTFLRKVQKENRRHPGGQGGFTAAFIDSALATCLAAQPSRELR